MTLILQSSMSCKYNSPDNGMMESFFGILNYYNNKRIKIKLKGLSPVQYRTKSFA